MNDKLRKSCHDVLDAVLNELTDAELSEGCVDIIVQQTNVIDERFYKRFVHALCCPVGGILVLDDMSKVILPGESIEPTSK